MMTRFIIKLLCGSCVLLALLNGCATAPKTAPKSYTFFPPAPDEPRVQYLTSFSSDTDLGRTSGFAEFVTGARVSPNQLVKPYGVALKNGKVFVCDTMGSTIHEFDLSRKRSQFFSPRGEGRLLMPVNVTIDEDGT